MKITRSPKCSVQVWNLQFFDHFFWWHRVQKQCGPMIERKNTVGPLKRKVLICLGCTKNGLLMPLSTCSVLSHGAFICTCPFLMTWVCLVEDIYVSPKFPCRVNYLLPGRPSFGTCGYQYKIPFWVTDQSRFLAVRSDWPPELVWGKIE